MTVLFSEEAKTPLGLKGGGALQPPSAPSNDGSVSTQCWHAWRLLVVESCANLHHHRYMLAKDRNMK